MKKIIDFVKRFAIFAMIAGVLAAPVFAFAQGGAVVVAPPSFDFGDILQSNGKVSTIFTVTNSGAEALKINRLSTSCGCTTAEMDLSDFAPGESRELKVTFDPQVHEDQFGAIGGRGTLAAVKALGGGGGTFVAHQNPAKVIGRRGQPILHIRQQFG